jgi:hypothetical protein
MSKRQKRLYKRHPKVKGLTQKLLIIIGRQILPGKHRLKTRLLMCKQLLRIPCLIQVLLILIVI